MVQTKCTLLAGVASLLMTLSPVHAEDQEGDLQDSLMACRTIDSALERLDCYDRIARTLSQADDDESLRGQERGAAAREQAQQRAQEQRERAESQRSEAQQRAREEATSDFGREHRNQRTGEDVRYVDIVESWQNPRGLWRFRMADGSEWHQTQAGRFQLDEDETYFIRRGALNSFMLGQESNNRTIRVRRVD